jgi:hypothetical protein
LVLITSLEITNQNQNFTGYWIVSQKSCLPINQSIKGKFKAEDFRKIKTYYIIIINTSLNYGLIFFF